jgi:hypothetical protein
MGREWEIGPGYMMGYDIIYIYSCFFWVKNQPPCRTHKLSEHGGIYRNVWAIFMGDMMISHGFCHPVEPFKGTQLIGYDIPSGYLLHSHGFSMALIEIDGLSIPNGGSFHGEL